MTITPKSIQLPIRDAPNGAIVGGLAWKQIAEVSETATDENGEEWYKTPLGYIKKSYCKEI